MLSTIRFAPALLSTLATALILALATPAMAGPPLICQRFDTGGSPSLPWGEGQGWDAAAASYDVRRLTGDTMRLLTPATPVKARMETLRRATLYAARDARVASELLAAFLARALDTAADGKVDALTLFDAGYLVESYRQASHIYKWNMLGAADRTKWALKDEPSGLEGYTWVQQALKLAGENTEMQFAASLMKEGAPKTARAGS